MSSPSKRRDMDVMKLMMSDFEVSLGDSDNPSDFYVKFYAPKDSLYEGGIYRVHVTLPATYPYKSPSIGFNTKIFHPNVDEASGSVCLDVINQTWSPMFDLVNIFSVFLPQLLLYPNPADPLNGHAAALMFKEPELYKKKIQEHVKKHASVDFTLGDEDEKPTNTSTSSASASSSSSSSSSSSAASSSTSGTSLGIGTSANGKDDDDPDSPPADPPEDDQPMSEQDEEIMSDLDETPAQEED